MQEADRRSIDTNEKTDVRVADEALVTEQRHLLGLGGVYDAHGFFRIVGNQHQSPDAEVQQLLGLPQLQLIVALGRFDEYFRAQLGGTFLKPVEVRLPALDLQRIHEKADLECGGRGPLVLRTKSKRS